LTPAAGDAVAKGWKDGEREQGAVVLELDSHDRLFASMKPQPSQPASQERKRRKKGKEERREEGRSKQRELSLSQPADTPIGGKEEGKEGKKGKENHACRHEAGEFFQFLSYNMVMVLECGGESKKRGG